MDDQKYTMSLDIRIWQWSSQTLSSKVWVLSGLRTFGPRFWLTNRWVQVVCMVRRCDCHRIEMRWVYLQKYTYHIIMNNNELYIYIHIYIFKCPSEIPSWLRIRRQGTRYDISLEMCKEWRDKLVICSWNVVGSPSRFLCISLPFHLFLDSDTSSTAQGGGGSLKNRKPIGEIGCCECPGWQSEAYLPFSDYLATYLLTYLSMYVFIHWSLSLSPEYCCVHKGNPDSPFFQTE